MVVVADVEDVAQQVIFPAGGCKMCTLIWVASKSLLQQLSPFCFRTKVSSGHLALVHVLGHIFGRDALILNKQDNVGIFSKKKGEGGVLYSHIFILIYHPKCEIFDQHQKWFSLHTQLNKKVIPVCSQMVFFCSRWERLSAQSYFEYPQDCPPQDWPHGGQSWGG